MSNYLVLVSLVAFSAIALPGLRSGFLSRLSRRLRRVDTAVASRPVVTTDNGWTMIRCDDPVSFGNWLGRDEEGMPFKDGEELSLGSHLLVELYGCEGTSLEQEITVGAAMKEAAMESEATVVADSFHEFKPYGVSGAVIIQESHYTIHTWPEHGYAAVDLFYCGGTVKVRRAVEVLEARFKPKRIKFLVVRRGLQGEVERAY